METRVLDYPECESIYRDFNRRQYRMLAQHSWAWQKVLATFGGWRWRAIGLFEGSSGMIGCIPFCEKETEIGRVLMSSPIPASYAGVLHVDDCDRELVYKNLLHSLVSYAVGKEIDIVSILTSPFRDETDLYMRLFEPTYVFEKFYQYLPGDMDLENLAGPEMHSRRKNLKKASRSGLEVKSVRNPDADLLNEWYQNILSSRFTDFGVEPAPFELFETVADELGREELCEFAYVEHEGRMVSGGLFLYGWCQDIYLRATLTNYMGLGAGVLLDYEMLKRGRELRAKAHNFQSSPSKDSPSYTYKKRWGCLEGSTFYLVKVITDHAGFIHAGREAVTRAFPHFFVLPYSVYEEES